MQQIIDTARLWLGTPFHHQGRVRQVGCDYIGLIIGVAASLHLRSREGCLLAECDVLNYPRRPRPQESSQLKTALSQHLWPATALAPGRIALFADASATPHHVGIISSTPYGGHGLIHAYLPSRKVVEHNLDPVWAAKLVAVFAFTI